MQVTEKRDTLFDTFQAKFYRLHVLTQQMHQAGDYDGEHGLLRDVVLLEQDILSCFGLDHKVNTFSDLLQRFGNKATVSVDDVKDAINMLRQTAEEYLLSAPQRPEVVLETGRDNHRTAFDVLPLIDIDLNDYNIFLYERLFYAGGYAAKELLSEMKKGNALPATIFKKPGSNVLKRKGVDDLVQKMNLFYWDGFTAHLRLIRQVARLALKKFDALPYFSVRCYPETMLLKRCYISDITYVRSNKGCVIVSVIVNLSRQWCYIQVFMSFDEVMAMLQKTIDHVTAALVRCMLFDLLGGDGSVDNRLQIRHWYDTYLFCDGCSIHLFRSSIGNNEEENMKLHNVYETIRFFDLITGRSEG